MAGFNSLKQINTAFQDGQTNYFTWRKAPSQATTAGLWFDMAMMPGNPPPLYYASAPLVAAQIKKSTDGGLNHGPAYPAGYKYLNRFLMMSSSATGLPMPFILCDYLLYYPFIDQSTNDEQFMDNTITLPRFTDGKGVRVMAVGTNASSGLFVRFFINYTNSDGVAGRISPDITMNIGSATGTIISSDNGGTITASPFLPLASGDSGVQSIQSITFPTTTDVGLFCLVLVKPLVTGVLLEQTAPFEVSPLPNQMTTPRIYDDAFINFICLPRGSLSGVGLHGEIETIQN
jgi:hypothetical protein